MNIKKINIITSIPKNNISEKLIKILDNLSFYLEKRGYRDVIYYKIPDIEDYINFMNNNFYFSNLSVNLEVEIIDEYGDKLNSKLIFEKYDIRTFSVYFLKA